MTEISTQPWMNKYLGAKGAEKMQSMMNNEEVDENYFAQQGVNVEGEIDLEEWQQIALKASGFDNNNDIQADETNELYIETEYWNDSIIDDCYNIEELSQDSKTQSLLRELIKKEIFNKNGLSGEVDENTAITNGKLYLPSLDEITNDESYINEISSNVLDYKKTTNDDSKIETNTEVSTTPEEDCEKLINDLFNDYKNDKDADIAESLENSGILNMESEPNTELAGLQALYYAFGEKWDAIVNDIKYNALVENDNCEINYEEKFKVAINNLNDGKEGYSKEQIKKAAEIYWGNDIPENIKSKLGITKETEIQDAINDIEGNEEGSSNDLDGILSDLEDDGNASSGTLEAEILAIKSIYGDSYQDFITSVGSDAKPGDYMEKMIDEWQSDTSGKFDDKKILEACKKFYGSESIWPDSENINKEQVAFLADIMDCYNEYKNGTITQDGLQNKLGKLSDDLDKLENLEKGTFIAGLKALREAFGDDWYSGIIVSATCDTPIEDLNFESSLAKYLEITSDSKDRMIEVYSYYYNEEDFPLKLQNKMKDGENPKNSTMTTEEINAEIQKIYDATEGFGYTDEKELSKIIMGHSPNELKDIIASFDDGAEGLKDLVRKETSGQYEEILIRTIDNAVNNTKENESTSAASLAKELENATSKHGLFGWGTDEDKVYSIILDTSDDKLKELAKHIYNNKSSFGNKTLEELIRGDFSGDDCDALIEKLKRLGITDEMLTAETKEESSEETT